MIGEFQPMPSMIQSAPQTVQQAPKSTPATDLILTRNTKGHPACSRTLNLSSEQEALRALVALGMKQFKKLS